ncbi:unnamed protein product [Rhizophagus irregularis]|nr:unnamed protein product [Rhizophagus irregularis]CAB5360309.1 unnamed protein product [Rhizophagus irregularis]
MSISKFKTVTIAGGTIKVDHIIAEAFLDDGSYQIKILRRKPKNDNKMAKSLASKGAEIVYVDYNETYNLVKALKGTDVLISALNVDLDGATYCNTQAPAKDVSVKRFIPSVKMKVKAHPITDYKNKFRDYVEESGLEYTYIYFGLLQEHILRCRFDIKEKKATFYDDVSKKIPTTSFSDFGKYTVESLKTPEARNSEITVSGANMSLNEYIDIFEKVSGEFKWKAVVDIDSFADNFKDIINNKQNNKKNQFLKNPLTPFSYTFSTPPPTPPPIPSPTPPPTRSPTPPPSPHLFQ